MKTITLLPFIAVCLACVLLPGCATKNSISLDNLDNNSHGLNYWHARQLALALRPGMNDNQVIELLGPPDTTGFSTFGSLTDHPWQGWVYDYHWPLGPVSADTLEIVFQSDQDAGWKVNSWSWQ